MSYSDDKKNIWGKLIGEWSLGKVYEVRDNGSIYAGKKIPKYKLKGKREIEAYDKELDILRELKICENSIKLYSDKEDENDKILILELCNCKLEEMIQKSPNGLDENMIYAIMDQLNNVFELLYKKNIIHRDIKPSNIMIKYIDDSNNSKFIPKINDYGLSREINDYISTGCGNSIYMAPEILLGLKYTQKVDLWSVGIMIYYMHFKEYPFKFPNFFSPNSVEQFLDKKKKKDFKDKNLDDLVNQLLVYNPDNRLNWEEYFEHPFFKSKLIKRFSGDQYILINCEIHSDGHETYIINDRNIDEDLIDEPVKFTELNKDNTDMYIDGKLTKFRKYVIDKKEEDINGEDIITNKEIKYVFDHKLKRLNFMFYACPISSVKFVNVDTTLVNTMEMMFSGCGCLEKVDLSCCNTKNLKLFRIAFLEVDLWK